MCELGKPFTLPKLDLANVVRHLLGGKMKALGPEHVLTTNAFSNLAHIYYIKGKLDEAEELHQRSLAAIEKA